MTKTNYVAVKRQTKSEFISLLNRFEVPHIPLKWSSRLTTSYGYFKVCHIRRPHEKCEIVLAERLAHFSLASALGTMRHEVAHYLNFRFNNSMKHDANFHSINKSLNGSHNGKTYDGHRIGAPSTKRRRKNNFYYKWQCQHGNFILRKNRLRAKLKDMSFLECGCIVDDCPVTMEYIVHSHT